MIRRSDRAHELTLLARATQCGNPTFIKAVLLNPATDDPMENLTLRYLGSDKARRDMLAEFARAGESKAVTSVVSALADQVLRMLTAAKEADNRFMDRGHESAVLRTEASKLENFCVFLASIHDEARRPRLDQSQELPALAIEEAA